MFAVLQVGDFALQAVLRSEPAVASRPAALFAGTAKKSLVVATNAPARIAGVELGMTAPQAAARCPTVVIRTRSDAAETEARAALLAVGLTLSPCVEDTAPGVCTVDLRGVENAKLESLIQVALDELTHLGLPATAGIAATPLMARYAAHAARATPAKSDKTSPKQTPCFVLRVTDPAAFLAPLPLTVADPSAELAEVFTHWGIRTLGELTALPRDEIVRRFGAEGLALWRRASGGAARPLHPVIPPQTFAAEREFEAEIETLEPLLFVLRRFLERLTLELRATQQVAAEIDLSLRLENDAVCARRFRLPDPTADVEILFRTLHTHLESLQTDAAIAALQLRLVPTRPLVRQQGLFEAGLRDPSGFAETLARAGALLEAGGVGTPQLEDSHRPDAFKIVAPLLVIPPASEPPLHPPLGLPLRRFRPPVPARLEFTHGKPTYLWTEQLDGEIARQSSGWQSSGEWWQSDRAWARQEWDIELKRGGLYRLLRLGDAYFIEGEYD